MGDTPVIRMLIAVCNEGVPLYICTCSSRCTLVVVDYINYSTMLHNFSYLGYQPYQPPPNRR